MERTREKKSRDRETNEYVDARGVIDRYKKVWYFYIGKKLMKWLNYWGSRRREDDGRPDLMIVPDVGSWHHLEALETTFQKLLIASNRNIPYRGVDNIK